ncbi:MAG: hypothetical protein KBONHNOK_00865 [Candidatus Methanoperedenaceae archaeon GB50]|nr:MAG: hypothetical protein KBONHNOK_00865 [Candidatus Methanoperedenaceae archaeon GB50]
MVEDLHSRLCPRIPPGHDRNRSLICRRGKVFKTESLIPRSPLHALKPCLGKHYPVILSRSQFTKTSIDVTAKIPHNEIASVTEDLSAAAKACCTDHGTKRKLIDPSAVTCDECIERRIPLQDSGCDKPFWPLCWHILHRVHGNIDLACKHRRIDLTHKRAKA